MRSDYWYLDPDYIYTDAKTGVLRNLGGVTDPDDLTFIETAAATKRVNELKTSPIRIADSNDLFSIHFYLFQDVYTWAGQRRTVEISKGGKQFFPLSHFEYALEFIDNLIIEFKSIDNEDRMGLSTKLAEILDTVNFLHPFREGNGRTQREFLRLLAREKGWALNLNPPDSKKVYEIV